MSRGDLQAHLNSSNRLSGLWIIVLSSGSDSTGPRQLTMLGNYVQYFQDLLHEFFQYHDLIFNFSDLPS